MTGQFGTHRTLFYAARIARRVLSAVIVLALLRQGLAQTPPQAVNPRIDQAIADLGSPFFTVRERASRLLFEAGNEARPALEKAIADSDDFETVYRARQIVALFKLGIYADTPAQTANWIKRYHLGNFIIKQQVIGDVLNNKQFDLARRLIAAEPNRQLREQLNNLLVMPRQRRAPPEDDDPFAPGGPVPNPPDIGAEARRKLAGRDFDAAEQMLREATEGPLLRDYAALLLARNKLDAEIARVRGKALPGIVSARRKLLWLLHVKGDMPAMIALAKEAKDDALLEKLLTESGDWKGLAKMRGVPATPAAGNIDAAGLARSIVIQHLAGDKPRCDALVATALEAVKQKKLEPAALLKPLVFTDRVDACIELMSLSAPQVAFDLLTAQNRMKEAFRLAKVDPHGPAKTDWAAWLKADGGHVTPERMWLAAGVVRALHAVGEDDRAQDLLAAITGLVAETQASDPSATFHMELIDAAIELGRPEPTDALAARLIDKDAETMSEIFDAMYGDLGEAAGLLWQARHIQSPGEEPLATLRSVRKLLTAKPDAALLEELHHLIAQPDVARAMLRSGTPDARARNMLALATLFHRYGDSRMTVLFLRRGGSAGLSAQTLLDQGNLLAEEKEWTLADRTYKVACNLDSRNAAALYLLGWVQSKLGQDAEGRRLKELALMLPLGDGPSRRELIRTLVRLGENEEAARQRQILLRTADFDDPAVLQTLLEIADAASPANELPTAEGAAGRTALLLLDRLVFLRRARYYLDIPFTLHRDRAVALLRSGKTAEAIDELKRAEAIMPENVPFLLECDAALRKQGAGDEADAFYRRMADRLEADCRDFPRGGGYHNDLAWLEANLNRDLDQALAHAQRAVELEPQSAGILDTLAEVHFRRGNRAEAVRLAKRCIELDPHDKHYQEQLARFEK